jgi:predicted HTH transcriptional regulator
MTATPLLDWTPRYPEVPGHKVPGPSQDAAEKVSKRVAYLQGKCLEALRVHGPLTADEIAEKVGESILSIRPRLSELVSEEYGRQVEKTKERRKNISGCSATVWRLP